MHEHIILTDTYPCVVYLWLCLLPLQKSMDQWRGSLQSGGPSTRLETSVHRAEKQGLGELTSSDLSGALEDKETEGSIWHVDSCIVEEGGGHTLHSFF